MWYLPPQPPHREQRRDLYEGLDKIEIEKEVGTGARARDKLDHAIFLPVTPRVEFKQTQKLDARTILDEKSAYIDPNPSWNMSNANVEMLDRIFKESLWMLDLVLDTPRRPEVFKRAFKDHRYQCAILVLLGWVRILLRSLIEREEQHASKPVLAQSRLKIVMVKSSSPVDAGTSATILSNVHTMYLFEDFCVDGVDELRTSLPLAVANSFHGDAAEVMCARASIMIHELIHYVSYIRKIEFREITGCRRAQRLIDARPPLEVAIRDCKAVEFLFKRSASDRYIVAWFKETRRAGRRKKTMHGAAYGLFAVEKLAKLEDGACASLLNADSYVAYVVMSRVELLRKAYANGPLPDLAVLV